MTTYLKCDTDDVNEIFEIAAELKSKCGEATLESVMEMVKSGKAKSEREATKKLAHDLGEPEESVRSRVKREKAKHKKVGSPEPKKPIPTDDRTPLERARDNLNAEMFKALDELEKDCADGTYGAEMIKQPDGTFVSKRLDVVEMLDELAVNIIEALCHRLEYSNELWEE
jgi:hypothetical protein